jgi:hypothetical protein
MERRSQETRVNTRVNFSRFLRPRRMRRPKKDRHERSRAHKLKPLENRGLLASLSSLSRAQRLFFIAWTAWLVVPAVIAGFWLAAQQRHNADDMRQRDRARMSEGSVVDGRTEPDKTPPPGHANDVPVSVKVGLYVDHIADVSIVRSAWKVDFFVWFTWEGAGPDPGETFRIVNGDIDARTMVRKSDEGTRHYSVYRVTAEITKIFNLSRFPLDEHLLTIAIEDQSRQSYQLVWTPDDKGAAFSSRTAVPGYKIAGKQSVVKPHSYRTPMGDPVLPEGFRATYSQYTFGMTLVRPSLGLFFKMFIGLYLSVVLGLIGLLLRGGGERLGLASTALFIALVNGLTIGGLTPDTGSATLGDEINNLGYLVIGQFILQAVIYHGFFKPSEKPGRVFDAITLVAATTAYVALNILMIVCGSA